MGPQQAAECIPTRETEASKAGKHYVAANETPIYNIGEKQILGNSGEGIPLSMTMQVADLSKVLVSTGKTFDAGNIRLFTKEGGWIVSEQEST